MASIKIVLGGGNPAHSVDIGDDVTALQMMRDVLDRDPIAAWEMTPPLNPQNPPETVPKLRDWQTEPDDEIVKAFAAVLVRAAKRGAKRRKPHLT